ncbi:MAG: hypothetical protein DHS20C17_06740 [Cyclobacteriaceae bacterium]|nr:MAG: hypothetical protein DHS20C17_06740 [Cyclobacteriaceae bacterium]
MKNVWIIAVVILFPTAGLFAGDGWIQKKNTGYFKLSQYWVIADQHYTNTGGIDPNATRATFVTSLYAEYGFTDRITGVLYFPFFVRALQYEQVSATTGELILPGDAVNSLGDTQLTLKYGLIQNDQIALSGSISIGLPFGKNDGGRDGSLQTGTGAWSQMLRLDASKSFKVGNVYPFASIYTGFNNRTKGFSDEFRYGAKIGVSIERFSMQLLVDGVKSLKNGDANFNSEGTGLYSNNAEFVSITPEIGFRFNDKWGVSLSYATAMHGNLIFARPAYSAGVFFLMQ